MFLEKSSRVFLASDACVSPSPVLFARMLSSRHCAPGRDTARARIRTANSVIACCTMLADLPPILTPVDTFISTLLVNNKMPFSTYSGGNYATSETDETNGRCILWHILIRLQCSYITVTQFHRVYSLQNIKLLIGSLIIKIISLLLILSNRKYTNIGTKFDLDLIFLWCYLLSLIFILHF